MEAEAIRPRAINKTTKLSLLNTRSNRFRFTWREENDVTTGLGNMYLYLVSELDTLEMLLD